jgi:ElaB/YqjD/DUF883 family membrane-anchored ribosome-binding protein
MSTRVAGREYTDGRADRNRPSWVETKSSFLTTEFYAMIAAIVGVIVAGESNGNWDDRWVWQVVAAIAIGYMLSRGLAKSGSMDRRDDERGSGGGRHPPPTHRKANQGTAGRCRAVARHQSMGAVMSGQTMGKESGSVGEKADEVKGVVVEQAGHAADRGRNVAQQQLDQRSTELGEQVGTAAWTLRQVADQSRTEGNDQQARLAEAAAERGERLSNYLVEADGERMLREAEDFARREPWVVAGAGLAIGFVLARALKASSSTRYQRHYPDSYRRLPARTESGGRSDWQDTPAGQPYFQPEPRVGNGEAETTRIDIGTRP